MRSLSKPRRARTSSRSLGSSYTPERSTQSADGSSRITSRSSPETNGDIRTFCGWSPAPTWRGSIMSQPYRVECLLPTKKGWWYFLDVREAFSSVRFLEVKGSRLKMQVTSVHLGSLVDSRGRLEISTSSKSKPFLSLNLHGPGIHFWLGSLGSYLSLL